MKVLVDLLFFSVNQVIKTFAADPQWRLAGNTAKYEDDIEFDRLIKKIAKKKWSGYAKAPFSG
jgi:hypothetical protein